MRGNRLRSSSAPISGERRPSSAQSEARSHPSMPSCIEASNSSISGTRSSVAMDRATDCTVRKVGKVRVLSAAQFRKRSFALVALRSGAGVALVAGSRSDSPIFGWSWLSPSVEIHHPVAKRNGRATNPATRGFTLAGVIGVIGVEQAQGHASLWNRADGKTPISPSTRQVATPCGHRKVSPDSSSPGRFMAGPDSMGRTSQAAHSQYFLGRDSGM